MVEWCVLLWLFRADNDNITTCIDGAVPLNNFFQKMYGNKLFKNTSVAKLASIRQSRDPVNRNFTDKKQKENPSSLIFDKNEVEHHEAQAKGWWDIKGPMKGLHALNAVRIPLIRNGLVNTGRIKVSDVETKEKYLSGVKILDVGCGGGVLSEALARLGANVTGIDPSKELTSLAKYHASLSSEEFSPPTYIATTVEEHSEEHRQVYDAIVASEVIEHVSSKESFVKGCVKVVKPGGSLFFSTPNRSLASWLGVIIGGEYIFNILPKGTHQYEKFITPSELSTMLEREGCKTQLINGMIYDVLRNKWLWTPTTAFVYALHAVCDSN